MNTPTYLNNAQLVTAFPAHSYDSIAATGITDPNFSGLLIDLNTGYVINATGEMQQTVPLIAPSSAGSSQQGQGH